MLSLGLFPSLCSLSLSLSLGLYLSLCSLFLGLYLTLCSPGYLSLCLFIIVNVTLSVCVCAFLCRVLPPPAKVVGTRRRRRRGISELVSSLQRRSTLLCPFRIQNCWKIFKIVFLLLLLLLSYRSFISGGENYFLRLVF